MPTLTKPIRRGRSKNLTYDYDALELLEAMCAHVKCQGKFVSELIRQEARLREERQRLKDAMVAILTPPAPPCLDGAPLETAAMATAGGGEDPLMAMREAVVLVRIVSTNNNGAPGGTPLHRFTTPQTWKTWKVNYEVYTT